jgi:hypothetical protein
MSLWVLLEREAQYGGLISLKFKESEDPQFSRIPVLVLERGETQARLYESINEAGRALKMGLTREYVRDIIRPELRKQGRYAAIINGREFIFYGSPYMPT